MTPNPQLADAIMALIISNTDDTPEGLAEAEATVAFVADALDDIEEAKETVQ